MIKVKSVELEKEIHDPRCASTTHQTDRSFDVDRAPLGIFPLPGGDRNERLEIGYSERTNLLFFRGWRRDDAGKWEVHGEVIACSAMNANEIVFAQAPEFVWEEKKPEPKK